MKLQKNNTLHFVMFIIAGLIIGSLTWDLFEVFMQALGIALTLQAGPFGFDLGVIVFFITFNPGSVAGIITGILLFRKI